MNYFCFFLLIICLLAVQQQTIPNVATLWKNVTNNPSDFMSWTYLLHSVEQMVCKSGNNHISFKLNNHMVNYNLIKSYNE